MAPKEPGHRNLRNNLNDFDLSDDEFEDLRSEYEYEYSGKRKPGKAARIAKIAGIVFLTLASLFIIQQFFFPYGPDITTILRFVPASGTILVILIGLGLLTRARSRKSRKENSHYTQDSYSQDSCTQENKSRSDTSEPGPNPAHSGPADASEFDSFAYANRKRWYRSRREKMIFGVCGGIGERFQIDPTIIRALFVLAFFSYGFSLFIYIVMAIVMPKVPVQSMT